MRDLCTYPVAILKGPIVRKERRTKWVDGVVQVVEEIIPTWSAVHPQDFYPSPNCTDVNTGYLCERVTFDRSTLAGMAGVEGWNAAEIEAARVRARVVREVREAAAESALRSDSIATAEQGLRDAAEALDLYRGRLTTGVGLPLEAILAEDALARARLDWIDTVVDYDKAQLRLLRALGGNVGRE